MTEPNYCSAKDFANKLLAHYVAVAEGREEATASISTGFQNLDAALGGGLPATGITIFASESGAGKTTLMCNIAKYIARDLNVLYVSTEQSKEVISATTLQTILGFPTSSPDILDGYFGSTEQRKKIINAVPFFSSLNINFTDSRTIPEIDATIKELKPDLLILDSIQGMTSNQYDQDLYQETSRRMNELVSLSISNHIPILASSHMKSTATNELILSYSKALSYYASTIALIRKVQTNKDGSGDAYLNIEVFKTRTRNDYPHPTCQLLWKKNTIAILPVEKFDKSGYEKRKNLVQESCTELVNLYIKECDLHDEPQAK